MSAAPAKLHHAHSTATGAAGSGAERAGDEREEDVGEHPADHRPDRQRRGVPGRLRGPCRAHRGRLCRTPRASRTSVARRCPVMSVAWSMLVRMEILTVVRWLAPASLGLRPRRLPGPALGARRSRRTSAGHGRPGRGDAGPRPAQRPDARPRPAARLVAGRVPPAGHRRWPRETRSLSTALRKPQVRGRWGELHLRRAVELAGLVDRCDFSEQVRLDDGALRPDLVVHLVGRRQVVVDAKVPLDAYLDATSTDDDAVRRDDALAPPRPPAAPARRRARRPRPTGARCPRPRSSWCCSCRPSRSSRSRSRPTPA